MAYEVSRSCKAASQTKCKEKSDIGPGDNVLLSIKHLKLKDKTREALTLVHRTI